VDNLGNATLPDPSNRSVGSVNARPPALTKEGMRASIVELLGELAETITDDDDLIRCGLDSISVMRLANKWRRHGVELSFAELIDRPTVARWWKLACSRRHAATGHSEIQCDEFAPFDLAPMQQAYWIGSKESSIGAVHAQYYVEFDGKSVQLDRLQKAVSALLRRHPMLRARFLPEGRQEIMRESVWGRVRLHRLQEMSRPECTEQLLLLRRALAHRPLAVERGEVFDVQLSQLPLGRSRMHVSITMLVADALSFQIILNDLAAFYKAPDKSLLPVGYSFQEYLATATPRPEQRAAAKHYWQERLADMPARPMLPLAVQPGQLAELRMTRRFYWMPPTEQRTLAQRCREHGLTLPVVLATAFAEIIGAWSSEPRFLLNVPVFERKELHADVNRLVGDFTNLIILAVDVSDNLPFQEQARRLQARLFEGATHSEYSGLEVLRDLAFRRPGDWMMAPVVFTSAIGLGDLFGPDTVQCFGTPTWSISQTPQVWLDHQLTELNGGLLFNWDIVEGLFAEGVVDAMFAAYLACVKWLGAPSSTWMEPIPVVLPPAQAMARAKVNTLYMERPEQLLHVPFFERAMAEPERVALAWNEDQTITYGALAKRALSVAELLQHWRVRPGDAVAVTMGRGIEQIAAVMGILAAGAVFIPVSIDQPVRRRAEIYKDAGAKLVLTRKSDTTAIEWPDGVDLVALDQAEGFRGLTMPLPASADSLAYLIYTSGSTGLPKGVEISHRAAVNTIAAVNERFGVNSDDRVLSVSSLDFDLSVYDIFGLLSVGGAVVLIDDADTLEAKRWIELAKKWQVTIWNSVPAFFDMVLVAAESRGLASSLRLVLASGDWVPLDFAARLRSHCPACRLVALGGATEAAIWSIAFEVARVDPSWRSVPYGFPLPNQKFRVIDGRGRDCPDWVLGELWIGGQGLAQGYRRDRERTGERFVQRDGERWYRTGDRGRYWHGGLLEFLGRADLQVKIKGYRIELGEIEAALQADPRVSRAVALAAGKDADRLAAVVLSRSGTIHETELRTFAADRLPLFMVPQIILTVDELPLSTNGKLDRSALLTLLNQASARRPNERPCSPIESELAQLWGEILKIDGVGPRDGFFALGGNSLLATRMVDLVRKRFGVDITLRQLLASPTLAELSLRIAQASADLDEGVI
jgi:yersiniabactin nonribosomal peptide synthetase